MKPDLVKTVQKSYKVLVPQHLVGGLQFELGPPFRSAHTIDFACMHGHKG